MVKMNGENEGSNEFAENRFIMKKTDEFHGWEDWKTKNKKGINCEILFERKGNRITLKTKNLGISIENTTTIKDDFKKVYAAITGDQVALTDISINSV